MLYKLGGISTTGLPRCQDDADVGRFLHTFNAWAEPFRTAGAVRLADPTRRSAT